MFLNGIISIFNLYNLLKSTDLILRYLIFAGDEKEIC